MGYCIQVVRNSTILSNEYLLKSIIEQLEDLSKCLRAARPINGELSDSPEDPSYPYAVGYCMGGINNAIYDINRVIKQLG